MSVKQQIIKLARSVGLEDVEIDVFRFQRQTFWTVLATNPTRFVGLSDIHQKQKVGTYVSFQDAQKALPGDAQQFIEKINQKRAALDDIPF